MNLSIKEIMKRNEMIGLYGGEENTSKEVLALEKESERLMSDKKTMCKIIGSFERKISYYHGKIITSYGEQYTRYEKNTNFGKKRITNVLNFYSELIDKFFNLNTYAANMETSEKVINQILNNINVFEVEDFEFIKSKLIEENHKYNAYIYKELIYGKCYYYIMVDDYKLLDYKPLKLEIFIKEEYIKENFIELAEIIELNTAY